MNGRTLQAALAALALFTAGCDSLRHDEALREGNAAAREGRLDDARAAFDRAVQAGPPDARAHLLLGQALWAKGDVAGASRAFDDAAALAQGGPYATAAMQAKARTQAAKGQFAEALRTLDAALAQTPDDRGLLLLRASVLLRRAQPDDAAHAFADAARASAAAPEDAEAQYALGCAQVALGRLQDAQGTFEKLAERAPESPLSWYGRARLFAAKHDKAMVLTHLQEAKSRAHGAWRAEDVLRDPAFASFKTDADFLKGVRP